MEPLSPYPGLSSLFSRISNGKTARWVCRRHLYRIWASRRSVDNTKEVDMTVSALSTDFYELTMMQGYFLTRNNPRVVFDMFYRTNPFNGGYVVFAGLNDLLKRIELFSFSKGDIDYLRSLRKFDEA